MVEPYVFKTLPESEYQALVADVTDRGLFERTYWHYASTGGIAIIGMGACLYALSLSENGWFQAVNAIFFAFFSVQIGMIGHDLSHGEVFKSKFVNRLFAMLAWGFFGGLSESRWFHKHNTHHENPNHIGHDPDLNIPFVFTDVQAHERSAFSKRWIFPYQHILFWPALAFVYPYNIIHSMRHIFQDISLRTLAELFLMIIHFGIVVGLPFYFLPVNIALLFLVVTFLAIGAYMGVVFAPNHKGEEVLGEKDEFNWTHQITLTRNILPSWAVFYLCGGLNFQIEHHLFPTMSRLRYWQARRVVMDFCQLHNIRYHQTTWIGSMSEIHQSLKEESETWRSAVY